jgi:hypothetical protein
VLFDNQGAELTCPGAQLSLPSGGSVVFTAITGPAGWPLRDFTITDSDCQGVANGGTCVVTLTNTLDDPIPSTTTTPATVPTTAAAPETAAVASAETVADPVAAPAAEPVSPFVLSGDIRLPETEGSDRRLAIAAAAVLLLGVALLRLRAVAGSARNDDLL